MYVPRASRISIHAENNAGNGDSYAAKEAGKCLSQKEIE